MINLFNKIRNFVNESFKKNEDQMLHFDRTVHWLKKLKPNATEDFLIAAIGHDIERAFRVNEPFKRAGFRDEEFLKNHMKKGAEILGKFLKEEGADDITIKKVKHLVSGHELGGDEDQNLLKDADSLSFVENNAQIFLSKFDELGYEKIKEKFDWMYERISSPKAKELAKPFYNDMMSKLNEYKN